jgi:hypothetical protein
MIITAINNINVVNIPSTAEQTMFEENPDPK